MKSEIPEESKSVLLVCLSKPEGVIFWTPLACALRKQWPFCRITWVTDEDECELLMDNQAADQVVVFPGRRWRPRGLISLIRAHTYVHEALSRRRYDFAGNLWPSPDSRIICSFPVSRRIRHFNLVPAMRDWLPLPGSVPGPYRRVAEEMGFRIEEIDYGFQLSHSGRKGAERLLERIDAPRRSYAIFAPFDGPGGSGWPEDNYVKLGIALMRRGVESVLIAGEARYDERARVLARKIGEGARPIAGETSWLVMRELIRQGVIVIGGRGATSMLARAVDIPAVIIDSVQRPMFAAARGMHFLAPRAGRTVSIESVLSAALSLLSENVRTPEERKDADTRSRRLHTRAPSAT